METVLLLLICVPMMAVICQFWGKLLRFVVIRLAAAAATPPGVVRRPNHRVPESSTHQEAEPWGYPGGNH